MTPIPAGWKPIESAPKNQLVMVYTPPQPSDWPDTVRISFDYIDPEVSDDYWYNHGEHYEHYCCVAKPENCTGPQERAPYTHWMPLPAAPGSPAPSAPGDAQDERQAFDRLPAYITDDRYHLQYRLGWNNCLADCRAAILADAPAAGDAQPKFDIEAAAQKLAECMDYPWAHMPEQGRTHMRKYAQAVIDAALAAQVPHKDKGEA